MLRIGKYQFGPVQISMIIVFVVLSACAVIASIEQSRPEWPVPLRDLIIINEGLALCATLIYGIIAHFALALIDRIEKK